MAVYWVLLLVMMFGPANPSNANDNTSGVAAILETMARIPEENRSKTAFILFDNEEKGCRGSKAYAKAHPAVKNERLVINLGVGAVILLAAGALLIVFRKKIPGFVKALKSECGKIVWCPKDKLKKNAIVVLVTILVIAVAIGLMDFAFSRGIMLLRSLFH